MKIPLTDCLFNEDEAKEVGEVLSSTFVTYGEKTKQFESMWADLCRRKHAIATCNGTASIIMLLQALGIGRGDKVLVPSMTFAATANAVGMCGAEPVWLDCALDTCNTEPEEVEQKIDDDISAVLIVHLFGNPCRSTEIERLCQDHGMHLIEDAAQAHGASFRGRPCGSFGIGSSFSYYGNKVMTCGEGGMALTDDDELARKLVILRLHGIDPSYTRRYYHIIVSSNYMLSNLHGALGVAQTRKLPTLLERKRRVNAEYRKRLSGRFPFQRDTAGGVSNHWLTCILVKDALAAGQALASQGIETRPFYCPCHLLPAFGGDNNGGICPNAEALADHGLSLPSGVGLTNEQIQEVCAALESVEPWWPEESSPK